MVKKQPVYNSEAEPTEVLIQQAPVVDSRRAPPLCLLTLHAPDCSVRQCLHQLSAMAPSLAQIRRHFLIRFAGGDSLGGACLPSLPANVEVLDQGACTDDSVLYRGRKLHPGWEVAARSNEVAKKGELAPTEAAIIRVLNLIRRNEHVGAISYAVKQDPGLMHGLLRYLNTAKMVFDNAYGGFRNFEQAIVFMGYQQFSKWLSMYLLHSSVEGRMPVLYLASIVRARLMEVLARPAGFPPGRQDAIFITGIFSLLDEITGVPMAVILQSLELDGAVREALLERKGEYAPLLELACASEKGSVEELARRAADLGLSTRELNLALLKAVQFASDFE